MTIDVTTDMGLFSPGRAVANKAVELASWLEKATLARQLAELLVDSAFVPMSYRTGQGGRPLDREVVVANATSAILLGDSLGVDPLTALQNIYLINGRPGMYTNFKIALLQNHGYDFQVMERSPEKCTIKGRKKPRDAHEETALPWTEVTITYADAERAGWTRNPVYRATPGDMLYARAGGRLCDMLDAAVLHGMATAEDLADYDNEPDVRGPAGHTRWEDVRPKHVEAAAATASTSGAAVADLIRRSPEADARLADVVEEGRGRPIEKEELPPKVREALYPEERLAQAAEEIGPGPWDLEVEEAPPALHRASPEVVVEEAAPQELEEFQKHLPPQYQGERIREVPFLGGTVNISRADEDADTVQVDEFDENPPLEPDEPPAMITTQRWNEINALFNQKHKINGEGMKVARYRVIEYVIRRRIENGRELTEDEGNRIYQFLTEKGPGTVGAIAYEETGVVIPPEEEK